MRRACLLSSSLAVLITFLSFSAGQAHEVVPAIGDLQQEGRSLRLTIRMPMEGILAGIDLANTRDTNDAPQAAGYDALRALPAERLAEEIRAFWPQMADGIELMAEGRRLAPRLAAVEVLPAEDPALARDSVLTLQAALPEGAGSVTFRWKPEYGSIVLRQQGVEAPYTGYLTPGSASEPIALAGGGAESGWEAFASYVPVGFRHILPLGVDHILFVLGLFLLSTRWRPLLIQISLFTLAHTITLALASLGIVAVPAAIVEPLIAASIIFVAVENIFTTGLSRSRPFVVFGFGLLHGLGFASVLGEIGLPREAFVPALVGFNLGVELGQLAVIAAAFGAVGWLGRKPWYHRAVTVPASLGIALVAAWWVLERTLLS